MLCKRMKSRRFISVKVFTVKPELGSRVKPELGSRSRVLTIILILSTLMDSGTGRGLLGLKPKIENTKF